eukprot:CAMPEP_0202353892 /NCGR_PEP_ID=MMETSP1126-20121109/9455_1 /ASSEMBLY_ACC=CAM_ASM_000457 /TAXON_ID=3047 /ORGANISM="Dunaliella tertiolecta, Strain CCMP1320" /LENGTH=567 /DNA_ID=CAMNT_0048946299 /DNA_START=94 /DNA_END=1798 /DNA_ORIENTATION=+
MGDNHREPGPCGDFQRTPALSGAGAQRRARSTTFGPLQLPLMAHPQHIGLLVVAATLGAAAWLLADDAPDKSREGPGAFEGGRLVVASLAVAVVMVFFHAVVIVAYAVRAHMRAKAMMELPTQQLLTHAQQATRSNFKHNPVADPSEGDGEPPFRLQFGRSDGAFGYTLFIPAEQEEEELRRAMQNYQPHTTPEAGIPLNSNTTSSNNAVGSAAAGAGAGHKKQLVKMRTLRHVVEPHKGDQDAAAAAAATAAAPPVVSFPPLPRSGGGSRNISPFRRTLRLGPSETRTSSNRVSASSSDAPSQQVHHPLDPGAVLLGFPGGSHAEESSPSKALQGRPHWSPPPPPALTALEPTATWRSDAAEHTPTQGTSTDASNLVQAGSPVHSLALGTPPAAPATCTPPHQPPLVPPQQQHPLGSSPAMMEGTPSVSWGFTPQAPSPPPHSQHKSTPLASASFTASPTQQALSDAAGHEDLQPRPTATIAAWDEPELPPQVPPQHTPGRMQRRRQQHRRTRSHPVEPEGAGDRLDVSLLSAGSGSPEQAEQERVDSRETGSLSAKSGGGFGSIG